MHICFPFTCAPLQRCLFRHRAYLKSSMTLMYMIYLLPPCTFVFLCCASYQESYASLVHQHWLLRQIWQYSVLLHVALLPSDSAFLHSTSVAVLALRRPPSLKTLLLSLLCYAIFSFHGWIYYLCCLGTGLLSLWQTHGPKFEMGYWRRVAVVLRLCYILFLLGWLSWLPQHLQPNFGSFIAHFIQTYSFVAFQRQTYCCSCLVVRLLSLWQTHGAPIFSLRGVLKICA